MRKTVLNIRKRFFGASAFFFLFVACLMFVTPAGAGAAVLWADTTPEVPITSPRSVRSVTLLSAPTKTVYRKGEALNVAGGRIGITYTDGSNSDCALSLSWCSGYNASTTGTQTVTVTYPDGGSPLSFNVTVKAESGIEIASPPSKTVYFTGDAPDKSGLSVRLKYTDGSSEPLPDGYTVTGFDTSAAGNKTAVVGYMGFTATFGFTVKEPQITKIDIVKEPTKHTYYAGDRLDTSGLSVKAVYDSGKTADVTSLSVVTGFKPEIVGKQTLTVSVTVGQNRYTDTYGITVVKLEGEKLEVTRMPDKASYVNGDEFDPAGIELTLTYNNGTKQVLDEADGLKFTGFDSSTTGTKNVGVTYGGLSAAFDVSVTVASGHVHTPGEYTLTLAATCAADGSETSLCTVCGEIAATRPLEALPHTWGDWNVTLVPTATSVGDRQRACTVCGAEEKETLPMLSQMLSNGGFTATASGDYVFPYGVSLDANISFGTLSETELAAVNAEANEKYNGEAITTFEIFYKDGAGERITPDTSTHYTVSLPENAAFYEKVILLYDGKVTESVVQGNSIEFDSSATGNYLVIGILPASVSDTVPVTTPPHTANPETVTGQVTDSSDVTSDNGSQPSDDTSAADGNDSNSTVIIIVVVIIIVICAILACIYLYFIKYVY